jgi:hypothetical protein
MDPGINPNSVVKLNVGGTTQGTLLSDQNSMLAKMFSTETFQPFKMTAELISLTDAQNILELF